MEILHFLTHQREWIERLVIAVILGGAIGFEREFSGRAAGFRTHILVCVGSCLITMVDASYFGAIAGKIAAQVVTGVGFLGAGTIMRSDKGQTVVGLPTAASLWATAGLGIATGYGPPTMWYAVMAAIVVLLTLSVATVFEDAVLRRLRIHRFHAVLGNAQVTADAATAAVLARLAAHGAKLLGVMFDNGASESGPERDVRITIRLPYNIAKDALAAQIADVPGIVDLRWEI